MSDRRRALSEEQMAEASGAPGVGTASEALA